jgi:hypothetical protein
MVQSCLPNLRPDEERKIMTFEEFARLLAQKARRRLSFDELAALAGDRFNDIGAFPTEGDPNGAIGPIVGGLRIVQEPFHFGRLTLFAGYLAEKGAPASEVSKIVAERLSTFFSLAASAVEASRSEDLLEIASDVAVTKPDAASAILAAQAMVAGAMTLFCQERAALRLARQSPQLLPSVKIVASRVMSVHFLEELLESSDEARITIIYATRQIGFEVVADNVKNGFHFFTLFEAALFQQTGTEFLEGPPASPEALAIARGERLPEAELVIRAHFDYFNWSAWGQGGYVADAPTRWIWGELPLSYIPQVDGRTIILIEKPRYVRTWDANLISAVHPDSRSSVAVTRGLPESEAIGLLNVFRSAPAAARQRMRYAGVDLS